MRQQDRVALFGALEAAAKAQYDAEKQKLIQQAVRDGTERFGTDGYGKVTISRRKGKTEVVFEDGGLTDWMLEHQPHNVQTIKIVMGAAAEALKNDCDIDGEAVIYKPTGEILPFAQVVVTPDGERYASWTGGGDMKAQAQEWVASRADELAAGLKEIKS